MIKYCMPSYFWYIIKLLAAHTCGGSLGKFIVPSPLQTVLDYIFSNSFSCVLNTFCVHLYCKPMVFEAGDSPDLKNYDSPATSEYKK